jgi:hypothetical protein
VALSSTNKPTKISKFACFSSEDNQQAQAAPHPRIQNPKSKFYIGEFVANTYLLQTKVTKTVTLKLKIYTCQSKHPDFI